MKHYKATYEFSRPTTAGLPLWYMSFKLENGETKTLKGLYHEVKKTLNELKLKKGDTVIIEENDKCIITKIE
jgi:hypothetical protein